MSALDRDAETNEELVSHRGTEEVEEDVLEAIDLRFIVGGQE